jgi:hypothetical protein
LLLISAYRVRLQVALAPGAVVFLARHLFWGVEMCVSLCVLLLMIG